MSVPSVPADPRPAPRASRPADPSRDPATKARGHEPVLRWWRELALVAALYLAYAAVRHLAAGSRGLALADARAELGLEHTLALAHERALQRLFLSHRLLVATCDAYYALANFLVTGALACWLAVRDPGRYLRLRRCIASATAVALVVFVFFPVMPPRLLPRSYGFVDTLATIGGAGPLDGHGLAALADPYAAMPSLHVAWAVCCAGVLAPVLRRRSARFATALYPAATALVVVVTANHLVLEVTAGAVLAGAALRFISLVERARSEAPTHRTPAPCPPRRVVMSNNTVQPPRPTLTHRAAPPPRRGHRA